MKAVFLTLTIFGMVCISNLSYAQRGYAEGYIVTYENDTLHGKIKHLSSNGMIKERIIFKKSDNEREYYDAEEILYFKVGSFKAASKKLDGEDKPVYLKVLATGHLTVYEHQYENNQTVYEELVYDLYVKKAGAEELTEIRPGNFRKKMEEFVSDVPKLAKAVDKKEYRIEDIGELAKEYNRIKRLASK